jgi:hypothetical protein
MNRRTNENNVCLEHEPLNPNAPEIKSRQRGKQDLMKANGSNNATISRQLEN